MIHSLSTQVEALMRQVAAEVVMPRYRQLGAADIEEKSPGELVTIADKESELRLNEGLNRILPEARLIGEEACAADPSLLNGLGTGTAWLIDPIDGTANFASGKPPFGLMVALVADGEPVASWIFDPLANRICHANAGGGAWIDGEKTAARGSGEALPIAAISTVHMTPENRARISEQVDDKFTIVDVPRCAAEQYPRLVLGQNDISIFVRMLPWDHVPGALFLSEAGGHIARPDGSPYHFWDGRSGVLAASTRELWDYAAGLLIESN